MTDPAELLASVSSAALRTPSATSSKGEAKPTRSKPRRRSHGFAKPDGKPLSRPHGRHAVARSDTSDEDADLLEQGFSPDPFTAGGYRLKDLKAAGIVSNRTDLNRKQREHGFPLPIKTGERAAWFPKSEVHAWLKQRAALRDTKSKK